MDIVGPLWCLKFIYALEHTFIDTFTGALESLAQNEKSVRCIAGGLSDVFSFGLYIKTMR